LAVPAFQFCDSKIESFDFFDRSQVSIPQEFDDLRLVGVRTNRLITVKRNGAGGLKRTER